MNDISVLKNEVRAAIATVTEHMTAGSVKSQDQYQRFVGQISAYNSVLDRIAEIQRKGMEND